MRGREIPLFFMFALALSVLVTGCGGSTSNSYHIRRDVDFSYIKRVAVLPFSNLADQGNAGDIVRHMLTNELLASGMVDVVMPGEVMTAVNIAAAKNVFSMSAEEIKKVGTALKVQAVIFGAVEKFGSSSLGTIQVPEVTLTLMMAETDTGSIIWSVTTTGGGAGFATKHLGVSPPTLSETALKVVRDAVKTLAKY